MALFATHIRFAMDLIHCKKTVPKDLHQYISGTSYPDSRWLSNIDRNLTHLSSIPDNIPISNDFKLGWLIHCRYDQIQDELYQIRSFQQNFVSVDKWIFNSALKVVQDMNDVKYIADINLKQYLSHILTPNGEDYSKIESFYQLMIEVYHQKSVINLSDYTYLWLSVGLSPDRTEAVINKIKMILKNEGMVHQIQSLYKQTVLDYLNQY